MRRHYGVHMLRLSWYKLHLLLKHYRCLYCSQQPRQALLPSRSHTSTHRLYGRGLVGGQCALRSHQRPLPFTHTGGQSSCSQRSTLSFSAAGSRQALLSSRSHTSTHIQAGPHSRGRGQCAPRSHHVPLPLTHAGGTKRLLPA